MEPCWEVAELGESESRVKMSDSRGKKIEWVGGNCGLSLDLEDGTTKMAICAQVKWSNEDYRIVVAE